MKYDFLINDYPLKVGSFGSVFSVSEDLVVRVPNNLRFFEMMLNGFEIQQELYDNGLFVPKPEGIVKICFERGISRNYNLEENQKGFLMQKIKGERLRDLGSGSLYLRCKEKYRKQIEMAEELGFIPDDDEPRNALVEFGTENVYAIDFDSWVRGD